jgi:putative transposase
MKTFEYRIYPNKEQYQLLMQCLIKSRIIYNEMLEMVKTQYEQSHTFPGKYDLENAFKGRGTHVPATTIQMLADRLSKSLKRFLAAKKNHIPGVGFPRFKKPNRWHSIQLRQYGNEKNRRDVLLASDEKHLYIPNKLGGVVKIKYHRPMEGTPKTAHLVLRADGHWYVLIVCETTAKNEHAPTDCTHPAVGIDVGLKSFLTDSEGNTVDNPRFYRKSQATLRRKQRTVCRRKKGSQRRRKACKSAAQTHLKIARQRRDHHFKVAKQYSERYARIVVEDLQINNMVQNHHLSKSIYDAGWGQFVGILSAKAESAGHTVIKVNPRYTTQRCSKCGELVQKSLSVRTHICPSCGYIADRDMNAAQNILKSGIGGGTAIKRQRTPVGDA